MAASAWRHPLPGGIGAMSEMIAKPVRIPLGEVADVVVAFYGDDLCLIWSDEWRKWWRPNAHGYTSDREQAGRYTLADAYARTRHCDPSKGIMFEQVDLPTPAPAGERAE